MISRQERISRASARAHGLVDKLGGSLVIGFHLLALFAIGATVVWAAVFAFFDMAQRGHATVEDILLVSLAVLVARYASYRYPSVRSPVREGQPPERDDTA